MNRPRILTGDRPTGPLHLGHYVGTLANRVRLQHTHDLFLIVADYHTLTTHPTKDRVSRTREYARAIVLDYLSVGIDPEQATIYVQSDVPEVAELALLFSNLVTVPRLERVPTLKETMHDQHITLPSLGLLSYPVLQAADILLVRADLVPVGGDQESHVEVTREIARRFNAMYGSVFAEPEALIGHVPLLVGIDGKQKMSKSLGNAIYLSDDAATVDEKVRQMYTDPARVRADIPGTVEGNPVFIFHATFNDDQAEVEDLEARYRAGRVGDVEVKHKLAAALNRFLDPIRERRAKYASRPTWVDDILVAGVDRARPIARETLHLAREAMGLG
jgi:tryptophanyl-tRNA synthetase